MVAKVEAIRDLYLGMAVEVAKIGTLDLPTGSTLARSLMFGLAVDALREGFTYELEAFRRAADGPVVAEQRDVARAVVSERSFPVVVPIIVPSPRLEDRDRGRPRRREEP
ncbi:MAG: hypothetical protein ACXWF9_00255 [Solirubrobacterales bacterium]